MKYLLLLIIPLSANATCFSDQYGNQTCTTQAYQPYEYRTDYNSPQLYENGQYRGNLNNNRYDPNSVSNPYGQYGNKYSPDSINNPYRVR